MGGSNAANRIEIGALDRLMGRNWLSSGEFRLLRKQGEGWVQIGLYGSATEAGEAADQAVGRGEGALTDFRVEEVRLPESAASKWGKRLILGALFLICAVAVVIVFTMLFT